MLRRVQPINAADAATDSDTAAFIEDAAADFDTVLDEAPQGSLRRSSGLRRESATEVPAPEVPFGKLDSGAESFGAEPAPSAQPAFDPMQENRDLERQSLESLKADLQWVMASERSKNGDKGAKKKSLFARIPPRAAILAVAIIAGAMAAFLAVSGETAKTVPAKDAAPVAASMAEPVPATTEQVLVAKKQITVGAKLTDADFGWEAWPKTSVHQGFLTETAEPDAVKSLTGSIARESFDPGQPIIKSKLAASAPGYLSAVLGEGLRAVSVQVSAGAASGGFINPGDHVDVILTRSSNSEVSGKVLKSETLLHNVRVLAINSRLDKTQASENGDAPNSDAFQGTAMATLELDPTRARVLVNAAAAGQLSLVLRSVTDFPDKRSASEAGANAAIRLSSPFWAD